MKKKEEEKKDNQDKQILNHVLKRKGDMALCGKKTIIKFNETNNLGRVWRII
jgi:hypothetical protein